MRCQPRRSQARCQGRRATSSDRASPESGRTERRRWAGRPSSAPCRRWLSALTRRRNSSPFRRSPACNPGNHACCISGAHHLSRCVRRDHHLWPIRWPIREKACRPRPTARRSRSGSRSPPTPMSKRLSSAILLLPARVASYCASTLRRTVHTLAAGLCASPGSGKRPKRGLGSYPVGDSRRSSQKGYRRSSRVR